MSKDFKVLDEEVHKWHEVRDLYNVPTWAQYAAFVEEVGELSTALKHDDNREVADAIGDCMVVLCNLARRNGLTLQGCYQLAYDEIFARQGKVVDGRFIKETASGSD